MWILKTEMLQAIKVEYFYDAIVRIFLKMQVKMRTCAGRNSRRFLSKEQYTGQPLCSETQPRRDFAWTGNLWRNFKSMVSWKSRKRGPRCAGVRNFYSSLAALIERPWLKVCTIKTLTSTGLENMCQKDRRMCTYDYETRKADKSKATGTGSIKDCGNVPHLVLFRECPASVPLSRIRVPFHSLRRKTKEGRQKWCDLLIHSTLGNEQLKSNTKHPG